MLNYWAVTEIISQDLWLREKWDKNKLSPSKYEEAGIRAKPQNTELRR